jgi:hypothetical protein
MDRLKRYHFTDDHGHPLENCTDFRAIFTDHAAAIAAKDAEILSHKAAMAVVLQGGESLLKDRDRLWAEAVCLSYRNAEQEMELALLRKVAEAAMAFTFGTDQRRFDDLMAALAELDAHHV